MKQDLLTQVEAFQVAFGLSDHRVGIILANNGRLLPRLRSGKRVWPETIAEIQKNLVRETRARAKKHTEGADQ